MQRLCRGYAKGAVHWLCTDGAVFNEAVFNEALPDEAVLDMS